MTTSSQQERQRRIADTLGVQQSIDPQVEIERRIEFLHGQLLTTGLGTLVLGISGGVDSTVTGRLAQLAAERARASGVEARFIAMRLPYGEQQDESDAQQAIDFIAPDETLTTDIRPASDAMLAALEQSGLTFRDTGQRDFVLGNIKARQRMIAQYAVAGARGGLVVGTDQAAEALMGFFTKHGDGACDLAPLTGLTKHQVRALGRELQAPSRLVEKVPTADLESLRPQRTDEEALGVSYDEIDAFLTGKPVDERAARLIVDTYERTEHKRQLPRIPGHLHASFDAPETPN